MSIEDVRVQLAIGTEKLGETGQQLQAVDSESLRAAGLEAAEASVALETFVGKLVAATNVALEPYSAAQRSFDEGRAAIAHALQGSVNTETMGGPAIALGLNGEHDTIRATGEGLLKSQRRLAEVHRLLGRVTGILHEQLQQWVAVDGNANDSLSLNAANTEAVSRLQAEL